MEDPFTKHTEEYKINVLIEQKNTDKLVDKLERLYPFLDEVAVRTMAQLAIERGQED